MTKNEIIDMMCSRDYTFDATIRSKEEPTRLVFVSNTVYDKRHKDKVSIPPYGCTVYLETDEFEFSYAIPAGINKLSTPKCGPVQNEDHFNSIAAKFENVVQILYRNTELL